MPEIEFVTVANHAEVLNGLLYLQGAGWTDMQLPIQPNGLPGVVHFGIAVSILIGWNETNQRFPLTIKVLHEDGDELINIAAQAEAGRPAGARPGTDLRSALAINAQVQFPRPGGYELRAELVGNVRSVAFRVMPPPATTGRTPG